MINKQANQTILNFLHPQGWDNLFLGNHLKNECDAWVGRSCGTLNLCSIGYFLAPAKGTRHILRLHCSRGFIAAVNHAIAALTIIISSLSS
ncbi:MAG: hypothetical protein HWQ41_23590 [Nostoc sp. NOS(2021)]|uniref:hypothetical protein n=1 Tax=Nostoc sp. NOS(2021) TaxID=2815407 RepID=UPI0025DA7F7B|nr:hypothetical protein [Nostoc sp. NOS(2021)]MBN3898145.1 hypothetical protein [Nostoc sp. NOS(2021)]